MAALLETIRPYVPAILTVLGVPMAIALVWGLIRDGFAA